MSTPSDAARFLDIFRPGAHAYYVFHPHESGGVGSKQAGSYQTIHAAPDEEIAAEHLAGRTGLVCIPLHKDGTCSFGAIDIDIYDRLDLTALAQKVERGKLPLIVCRSKSGGAHLYWFLAAPKPASEVRAKLADWAAALGHADVEIFPKQDTVAKTGNGINIPYFGDSRRAVNALGHELTLAEFFAAAEQSHGWDAEAPTDAAAVGDAATILAKHWTSGQREKIEVALFGYLSSHDVDLDEIRELVSEVCERAGDQEIRERMLKLDDLARRGADEPEKLGGFPKLVALIGKSDARAVSRALGITTSKSKAVKRLLADSAAAGRDDIITLRAGDSAKNVAEVIAVLARRGAEVDVFASGKRLTRPYVAKARGFDDAEVSVLELDNVSEVALANQLDSMIVFAREMAGDKGSIRVVASDCPERLAKTILAVPHLWGALPRLDRISSTPIYLGRGKLIASRGYHAPTRSWISCAEAVSIDELPTRTDAEGALQRLIAWIGEFPFASMTDRAAMLAAIMTAGLRTSLPAAPGVVIDGTEFGSGKTTAAKVCYAIATGREAAVMQFHVNDEEMRKQIDAAQLAGREVLVIDNVPTGVRVASVTLAQVLTEPSRDARVLGLSQLRTVLCTQLVLITGNNVTVADDLTRRLFACRLVPGAGVDTQARVFARPNLLVDMARNRGSILSDIYTIVAAFEAAAVVVNAEPLVGFEKWCRWVQQPLVWLGEEDPVITTRDLRAEDERTVVMAQAMDLWSLAYGDRWLKTSDICTGTFGMSDEQKAAMHSLVELLVAENCSTPHGGLDRKKLGNWLKFRRDRWAGGRKFERQSSNAKKNPVIWWRVVEGECFDRGQPGSTGVNLELGGRGTGSETGIVAREPRLQPTPPDPCDPGSEVCRL